MLKTIRAFVIISAVATFLVGNVRAIPKVSRVGRYLYNADGSRFYIKGIAYQEQGPFINSLTYRRCLMFLAAGIRNCRCFG
jgi:hypothetical protein